MVSEEIVGLLNKDLEGEHAAIIRYLTHAYSVGEGKMAREIEAIAGKTEETELKELILRSPSATEPDRTVNRAGL